MTAKLVALMLARVFSVKPEAVRLCRWWWCVAVVLVALGVTCGVIPKDCGRVMPRLRILSRLTSRMATSTTTSALGAVEIVQQLLGQDQVLRRRAHDDGVLRVDQVDLVVGVEHIAQRGDYFVGVGLLAGVGQIEGLYGHIVQVGVLLPGVGGDEDGVRRDDLVEGAGDGADDAQRIRQADIVQIDGDAVGLRSRDRTGH